MTLTFALQNAGGALFGRAQQGPSGFFANIAAKPLGATTSSGANNASRGAFGKNTQAIEGLLGNINNKNENKTLISGFGRE